MKQYLRAIRDSLPAHYPHKKDVLSSISQNLSVYFTEHPEADYSQLLNEFGSPEDVISALLDELPDMDVARTLRKRSRAHFLLLGAILSGIILIFLFNWYLDQTTVVSIEDTVYVYEETEK